MRTGRQASNHEVQNLWNLIYKKEDQIKKIRTITQQLFEAIDDNKITHNKKEAVVYEEIKDHLVDLRVEVSK